MAEALWNDLMYTDVMQTPGYVVDYAVCTTYSLDMPTLLSIPFMMGTMSELTEAALKSPHIVLEAVNRSADKFVVFCNAGSIAVPSSNAKVYSLLEKSVVQIALPNKGKGFANFHPKVWIIKETNTETGKSQIKVVVLSRNLTGSNDLDVVCELTGEVKQHVASEKAHEKHQPLVDFMRWLQAHIKKGDIPGKISNMMEDLDKVERFETEDSLFEDYDFFPMGVDGYEGTDCLNEMLEHASETVVISPFADFYTLSKFTRCRPGAKKTLITRHASIKPEMLKMFTDGVYAVKEVLTDQTEKEVTVDIHEKVFFIRNYYNCYNYLFVGSTNATKNGFERNVEFLVRLKFKPHKMSYDKFRQELINDTKDCIFEQVTAIPEATDSEQDAKDEQALQHGIRMIRSAQVEATGCEVYRITLRCNKRGMDTSLRIYPLYCMDKCQSLADGACFEDIPLHMLSEFFVLQAGDVKRIVKIECKGLPTEERDKVVFRSIINTPAKFLNYLAFMLTEDSEQFILESSQAEKEQTSFTETAVANDCSISLYEDMVRMAYRDPNRIASIQKVIEKADRAVLPDHFTEVYSQFEEAIKKIKKL